MATLVVTTLDDEDFDGPETVGTPDGTGLSLREALSLAGSDDTVTFDASLDGGTLTLTNGMFVLGPRDNFTIDGDIDNDGTPDITIDADGASQHFYLFNGSTDLTFDGLIFTGGMAAAGGSIALGANDVSIKNSVFIDNEAFGGGQGGAILTLAGSTLRITDTTFTDNRAHGASTTHTGGAISNHGNLYVNGSTFDGNEASIKGGAIVNYGLLSVANSTFVGNSALVAGAIYSYQAGAKLYIDSSTFTGNYASGVAGAIYSASGSEYTSISNSILSGNDALHSNDNLGTMYGFQNLGGNIIGSTIYADGMDVGDASLSEIFSDLVHNANTGVYSGQLANNGGLVETVMISQDGAAVNAGDAASLPNDNLDLDGDLNTVELLPIDANGVTRVLNGALDLGAVELHITNGSNGHNEFYGGNHTEAIGGGEGNDTIRGLGGHDTLTGDEGQDLIFGNQGADQIYGGSEDDDLRGGLDNDTLRGDKGNDHLRGNSSDDDLRGGSGNDVLDGGLDNDQIRGASGNDTLNGRDGNDVLYAGIGNDLAVGHGGQDLIYGEVGHDTLFGGQGDDTLIGGDGNDQFNFMLGDEDDEISDFVAGAGSDDVIALSGFGSNFDTFAEVIAATSDDGFGNAVIDFGGGDSLTLVGVSVGTLNQDDFVFG